MSLRNRLIGGFFDGLAEVADVLTSFWQTPREVEWAKAAADKLAEREAEEEVAEPDGCTCFWTPESTWTKHYGAVEPGSQREWNPECPEHPPTSAPTPGAVDGPAVGSPDKPTAVVGLRKVVDECLADLARLRLTPSAEVEPPASAPSAESPTPEFDWVTTAIPVIAGVLKAHVPVRERQTDRVHCYDHSDCLATVCGEFADERDWRAHVSPHIAGALQTPCTATVYDFPSGDRPRPLADFPKHQK